MTEKELLAVSDEGLPGALVWMQIRTPAGDLAGRKGPEARRHEHDRGHGQNGCCKLTVSKDLCPLVCLLVGGKDER